MLVDATSMPAEAKRPRIRGVTSSFVERPPAQVRSPTDLHGLGAQRFEELAHVMVGPPVTSTCSVTGSLRNFGMEAVGHGKESVEGERRLPRRDAKDHDSATVDALGSGGGGGVRGVDGVHR